MLAASSSFITIADAAATAANMAKKKQKPIEERMLSVLPGRSNSPFNYYTASV